VASRWLARLTNLLQGLGDQGGPDLLAAMQARGSAWLEQADQFDQPVTTSAPAPRPAPRPPVSARPKELPVTDIAKLIRDPYAIYAKRILRLKPLAPVRPSADALLKGRVIHAIMESFARGLRIEPRADAKQRLLGAARSVLTEEVAWRAERALWFAKIARVADFLLDFEEARNGRPILLESGGRIEVPRLGFTLTARPDRIDVLPDGRAQLIDYKTGTPPTAAQQLVFDKQLLLQAIMARAGAFGPDVPMEVGAISYLGIGASPKDVTTAVTDDLLDQQWAGFTRLIGRYLSPDTGYTSRRAVFEERYAGDYDHLARYGEWDTGDASVPQVVGDA
jgi:ATP-dependent helicase/nuclease subunit B